MPRFPGDDRYDEHGQDRWTHPDEEGYRRDLVAGGDEVRRLLRCSLCGKTLDARPDCAACGDSEEMAA